MKGVATATDKPAGSETKSDALAAAATDESKPAEASPAAADGKSADAPPAKEAAETKNEDASPAEKAVETKKEATLPQDTNKETLAPAPAPSVFLNGSAPPPIAGLSADGFDDDNDDLSDIDSVISDISTGVIDDAILEAKTAAENAPATSDEEDDEYQKDPWNAIAVVGLRVYCKGGEIGVKTVRPRLTEEEVLGPLKKEKDGDSDNGSEADIPLGDAKLDVDDSAKDATKNVEGIVEKAEEAVREVVKKDGDESQKGEHDSDGSVVMV